MKKFFLIAMMILVGCCYSVKAQPTDNEYSVISLTKSRERPKENGGETPIRRSISRPSVYAYIYNKVLTLDFMETYLDVTVIVTNENTGEVIYWESLCNPAEINIDLTSNGSGNYLIDIVTEDSSWEGKFSL